MANYNKEYVKTEVFPREMGRKISELEEIRQSSDYNDFYIVSKDEVNEAVVRKIMENIRDIKTIPFYTNVREEGVMLYE